MTGFEVFTDRGRRGDPRPMLTVSGESTLRLNKSAMSLLGVRASAREGPPRAVSVEVLWDRDNGAWAIRLSSSSEAYRVTAATPMSAAIGCSAFVREAGLPHGSKWELVAEPEIGLDAFRAVPAW